MTTLTLKPGKEKSLLHRHPWVFSGAVRAVPRDIAPGETVTIASADGAFIARGAWSPHSQIVARIWTFDPQEPVDASFFARRLARSLDRRRSLLDGNVTAAVRLVNAESDGLPGLIVDQYADYLVIQCLSAGAEYWKEDIVACLNRRVPNRGIYERSDADVREREGLPPVTGVVAGESPPDYVEIVEHGLRFPVDIVHGHKTGFYLDQRNNRRRVRAFARNARTLNCFAYTGGFGAQAAVGGAAHVVNVENSGPSLALLRRTFDLNGLNGPSVEHVQGNVFEVLRAWRDQERRFDLIILDPPKFAESRAQLARACRGYKDINWLAFRLLDQGGVLFTFSCSGLLDPALFQKIVADAALDADREAQCVARLGQASDHPVALNFPESAYLKGLICRV